MIDRFQGDEKERFHCSAAAFLMGCSSGRLKHNGDFDASGMALKYLTAGAPGLLLSKEGALLTVIAVVVANLWDVTDGDIDRFTSHLQYWTASAPRCLCRRW